MLSKDELKYSSLNSYDLKVASSHTNINENFANNVLKTKAENMYFYGITCKCLGLQKSISELER